MDFSEWGIGIVGLGGISRQHLTAYRARGLRVVAGADPDPRTHEPIREEYGIEDLFTQAEHLIALPEVRVVDVTAPHRRDVREPIFRACARAGKAIFCQKPLANNLKDAEALVAIAEEAGVPLMVNQNSVFVPGFRAMEPYLRDERWIGKPYYFQIENRNWFDLSSHPWFGKADRWITIDMGIHHLALVSHWFGEAESVYALFAKDPSQTGVKGENLSALSLRMRSGVCGLVLNNWCYRGDRPRPHSREEIVIQGDRGAITGDSEGICVTSAGERPARVYPEIRGKWFPDAFGNAMVHFLEALAAGTPYLCSGRDNLKSIAMAEAAYLSAAERREVRLSDLGY